MTKSALLKREWEFWCALAMVCDSIDYDKWDPSVYLCDEVDEIRFRALCKQTKERQWKYIPERPYDGRRGAWWPNNDEGNKARRDFCWKMAKLCEEEMGGALI